jgi:hypothetical protein
LRWSPSATSTKKVWRAVAVTRDIFATDLPFTALHLFFSILDEVYFALFNSSVTLVGVGSFLNQGASRSFYAVEFTQ